MEEPIIVDFDADRRFRLLAAGMGLNPDAKFVGGYVGHEIRRIGIFLGMASPVNDLRVLEVGCNVGATAIVARLGGGDVHAVDVDERFVCLARANAERLGVKGITFQHIPDTRILPFSNCSFEVVILNSVLEYIEEGHREGVLAEIDRVLIPGGRLIIHGTSNRLWPREVHTRRWFINYLPWVRDRGVSPLWVLRTMRSYRSVLTDAPDLFLSIKRTQGWSDSRLKVLRTLARLSTLVGLPVTVLLPSFDMILEKSRRLSP